MIIRVQGGRVSLEDIDTLTAFKVAATESDRAGLGAALAPAGRFDGEHAWISEFWVRKSAAGRPPEWTAGFEKMLTFARSKGWYDDASAAIRAHIDWGA
jgi:hypothetical protein